MQPGLWQGPSELGNISNLMQEILMGGRYPKTVLAKVTSRKTLAKNCSHTSETIWHTGPSSAAKQLPCIPCLMASSKAEVVAVMPVPGMAVELSC